MLSGFKAFISKGNVIDMAVGVIMGVAFGAIVNSLVADVITPAIGMVVGQPDFSGITAGSIMVGKFINAVISFLMIAGAVYFFIVVPVGKITAKKEAAPPTPPAPNPQEVLLKEIRDLLAKR